MIASRLLSLSLLSTGPVSAPMQPYMCTMHCACTVNLGGLYQAPKAQMPSDDLHQMVAALMVEMLTNDLTGIGLQTEGLTGV
jgi:hypothetical protein